MQSTRLSLAKRGYTVIELLVATTIGLVVLGGIGGLFANTRRLVAEQGLRIETQQAMRAGIDSLARDLRLSGACLPVNGDFVSLAGTDSGEIDSIITRTGLVQPNRACIRTALRGALAAAESELQVVSSTGFTPEMRAYIRHPNGTGETFNITMVSTSDTLQKSDTLSQDYPQDSGVYAIDEREYAIDTSDPTLPVLTVALDGEPPVPFALGIEKMNIRYQLQRQCPACDVVDLPTNEGEWLLVNQIYIKLTARSRATTSGGAYLRITCEISAKPRNLLPG